VSAEGRLEIDTAIGGDSGVRSTPCLWSRGYVSARTKILALVGASETAEVYRPSAVYFGRVLRIRHLRNTLIIVKSLTVRLPEPLVVELDMEARKRKISKSDIVRERLQTGSKHSRLTALAGVADLVGSVEGLPADLSSRRKRYLKTTGYGRKRPR
jgi:hypothetical protein